MRWLNFLLLELLAIVRQQLYENLAFISWFALCSCLERTDVNSLLVDELLLESRKLLFITYNVPRLYCTDKNTRIRPNSLISRTPIFAFVGVKCRCGFNRHWDWLVCSNLFGVQSFPSNPFRTRNVSWLVPTQYFQRVQVQPAIFIYSFLGYDWN